MEGAISVIGPLIDDFRICFIDSRSIDINWLPRDVNKMAHELALYCKFSDSVESLWNSPSTFVNQLLLDNFQKS